MAWRTYAADEPRFVTPRNWQLFEGQRTNGVRNPRAEGARAGVLGGDGAMPTNWALPVAGGVTVEVVGVPSILGVQCLRLRITGTATAGANLSLTLETTTAIAAVVGQDWMGSVFLARDPAEGATPNIQLRYTEHNSAGVQLSASVGVNETVTADLTRVSRAYTTAQATCAFIRPFLTIAILNGSTYNATIDWGWPQIERGPFASTPILPPIGSLGAATRSRDSLVIPTAGIMPGFEGSVIFQAVVYAAAAAAADQTIFQFDNLADTDRVRVRNLAGGTSLVAGTVIGGTSADAASAGNIVPGTPFKGILTLSRAGRLACLLSGGAVQSLTGLPTSLSWLRAANDVGGSAALNGELGRIETRSLIVPDAEMQSVLDAV